eukprot:6973077-Heterocapsa_arctica.AAC.1
MTGQEHLWVHEGDVKHCFYQYLLPEGLRGQFGLPLVTRCHLPVDMSSCTRARGCHDFDARANCTDAVELGGRSGPACS